MNTPFAAMQKSSAQMLEGMQKLTQLNIDLVQSSFAEAGKTAKTLLAVKSPQEFATLCTAELQAAPAKAAAYGAQVRDIFTAASQG